MNECARLSTIRHGFPYLLISCGTWWLSNRVWCLPPGGSHVRIPLSPSLRDIEQVIHSQLPAKRDVAPCVAAFELNSTPVITCYHPFILCLKIHTASVTV